MPWRCQAGRESISTKRPPVILRACDFFDVVKNRGCKQNSYDDKLVINSKKSQTLSAAKDLCICFPVLRLPQLDLHRPAVDEQFDSSYEAGIIRSQEEYRLGDLFWKADPAHGDQSHELVLHFLGDPDKYGGVDGARADDIHANLPGFQIHGPAARDGTNRGFARVVDAEASEAFDADN